MMGSVLAIYSEIFSFSKAFALKIMYKECHLHYLPQNTRSEGNKTYAAGFTFARYGKKKIIYLNCSAKITIFF